MDGVHDMGGMHGFGAVVRPGWERTHTESWEVRAQILSLMSNRGSRALIEEIEPDLYLSTDYYGRWLIAAENGSAGRGLDPADLARWQTAIGDHPDLEMPVTTAPDGLDSLERALAQTTPLAPAARPRFAVGDRVVVRRDRIEHHHRCPRYVRGAEGVVERICGEDSVPQPPGGGVDVEAVYTVRFSSRALWGEQGEEPEFALHVDLWQSYLEQA